MTDQLRDRIAAAITDGIIAGDGHGKIADALISELGLQTHLAKRIINGKPDQWVRRHVTDWEIVDE